MGSGSNWCRYVYFSRLWLEWGGFSGFPRLILYNTVANIQERTHHYKTPLYSPMLVVFNEDVQKGVGGIVLVLYNIVELETPT